MLATSKWCVRTLATEGAGRQASLAVRNQGADFPLWTVGKFVGAGRAHVLETDACSKEVGVKETWTRRKWKR